MRCTIIAGVAQATHFVSCFYAVNSVVLQRIQITNFCCEKRLHVNHSFSGYVLIDRYMFMMSARDKAGPSHYMYDARSDSLCKHLMFWLSANILEALQFFCLYVFELRMCTDLVVT